MKNKFVKLFLACIFSAATLSSCGTGTAIVFDKDGIRVVPGDSFVIPGTEVEQTK
jgi:hypothetical protein